MVKHSALTWSDASQQILNIHLESNEVQVCFATVKTFFFFFLIIFVL